jgi:hypothetical protein
MFIEPLETDSKFVVCSEKRPVTELCAVGNLFPNSQQLYEMMAGIYEGLSKDEGRRISKISAPPSLINMYLSNEPNSRWTVSLKANKATSTLENF